MSTVDLVSTSEADEQQQKTGRFVAVLALLMALCVLFVWIAWNAPSGLTILLSFNLTLGTLLIIFLAIERVVRQHRIPTLRIERGGVTMYPHLTAMWLACSYLIVVTAWGPAAIIFYLLQPSNVSGIILGISFSFLGYVLLKGTPHRPSNIHRSPIIALTPACLVIHPLLNQSPTRIPWDKQPHIAGIEQLNINRSTYNLLHVSTRDAEDTLRLDTTGIPLRFWQISRVINHFNAHPEDRATLGTPDGADLVIEILTTGGTV